MPQIERSNDCTEDNYENSTIDFDFWLYIANNFLNMNEVIFWKSTLRKLDSLYKIYRQLNGLENTTDKFSKCYCDDVDWI